MFKKTCILTVMIAIIVSLSSTMVFAKDQPVQLSLFTPIQIFPADYTITGIRLNLIYSRNATVSGFDWGLVTHTTSGVSKGVQWALVGLNDADFVGWQNSGVNVNKGDFEGFQGGLVNYANHASGIQMGFINYARSMKGLQIGLVNIIKQGGQFPVFPIINWSF